MKAKLATKVIDSLTLDNEMFGLSNTEGSILPTLWIKAYLRIGSHLLPEIANE
jgi:hypothetical protein